MSTEITSITMFSTAIYSSTPAIDALRHCGLTYRDLYAIINTKRSVAIEKLRNLLFPHWTISNDIASEFIRALNNESHLLEPEEDKYRTAFEDLITKYPDRASQLRKVFPEYIDNSTFCYPGQILKNRKSDYSYVVVLDRAEKNLIMINISLGYTFSNKVYVGYRDTSLPITMENFKKLAGGYGDSFYIAHNFK